MFFPNPLLNIAASYLTEHTAPFPSTFNRNCTPTKKKNNSVALSPQYNIHGCFRSNPLVYWGGCLRRSLWQWLTLFPFYYIFSHFDLVYTIQYQPFYPTNIIKKFRCLLLLLYESRGGERGKKLAVQFVVYRSRQEGCFFIQYCVYIYKPIWKKNFELSEAGGEKAVFSHSVILSISFE